MGVQDSNRRKHQKNCLFFMLYIIFNLIPASNGDHREGIPDSRTDALGPGEHGGFWTPWA